MKHVQYSKLHYESVVNRDVATMVNTVWNVKESMDSKTSTQTSKGQGSDFKLSRI